MLAVAVAAGVVIGLSLGMLGAGGSILAVPVLVYGLDQSAAQATTGSLVVVGVTSVLATVTARRKGTVRLARGLIFGLLASGGAVLGASAAVRVDDDWLMATFGVLMLVVAVVTVIRRHRGTFEVPAMDTPIITFHPTFACACPRAVKVLVTATLVGLLTGFLGVGGGFLVVPALILALGMTLRESAGTSLVVIAVTSAVAFSARLSHGVVPDWPPVALLTITSAVLAVLGVTLASRIDTERLGTAFTALIAVVGVGVTVLAVPALI